MLIVLSCPGCGKKYELSGSLAGKKARCRKCTTEFRVPVPRTAAAPNSLNAAAEIGDPSDTLPATPAPSIAATTPEAPPAAQEDTVVDPELAKYEPTLKSFDVHPSSFGPAPARAPMGAPPPRPVEPDPTVLTLLAGLWSARWAKIAAAVFAAFTIIVMLFLFVPALFVGRAAAEAARGLNSTEGDDVFFFADAEQPVPPAPRADLIARHTALLDGVLKELREMASLLASVKDDATSRTAAPKLDAVSKRLDALQQKETSLERLNRPELAKISGKYLAAVRLEGKRLQAEVDRLEALPRIGSGFGATKPALGEAVASLESELIPPGGPSYPPPTVFLRITHVDSPEEAEAMNLGLRPLSDDSNPTVFISGYNEGEKILRVRIAPVSDAKEFADRIEIGRVARVAGRKIAVVARKPTQAEAVAARESLKGGGTARTIVASKSPEPTPTSTVAPRPVAPRSASTTTAGNLSDAIAILNNAESVDRQTLVRALDRIRGANLGSNRGEVAKALEKVLRTQTDDRGFRSEVAKLLARWGSRENVPALVEFLKGEDFFGIDEILDFLISMKDPRAAETFASQLQRRRERAIKGLVAIGPEAQSAILPALLDKDDSTRKAACEVLQKIGTSDSVASLEPLLIDRNPDVLRSANEAIDSIQKRGGAASAPSEEAVAASSGDERRADQAVKLLAENEPVAPDREKVDRALRTIDSLPPSVRKAEVAKALERFLDASDRGLRAEVAKRLAIRCSPENVPALVKFLKTEDFFGRVEVMDALAKTKDPRAAEGFAFYLDRDRDRAVRCLIELGPGAEPAVLASLNHPNDGARKAACDVLRVIGTKQGIPQIEALLVDRNDEVSRSAEAAIDEIDKRAGGDSSTSDTDRRSERRLTQAIKTLATIDPHAPNRDVASRMFRILDQFPPNQRAAEIAKGLEPLTASTDDWLRPEVARRLAPRATKENTKALLALLQGRDFFFYDQVYEALARIRDPRSAEGLAAQLLKDRDRAARTLIAFGSGAEKAVQRYLGYSDKDVRRKACEILQQIGTTRSISALERASLDSDRGVAEAAVKAMQNAVNRRPR